LTRRRHQEVPKRQIKRTRWLQSRSKSHLPTSILILGLRSILIQILIPNQSESMNAINYSGFKLSIRGKSSRLQQIGNFRRTLKINKTLL
jgi:hypothetical protein